MIARLRKAPKWFLLALCVWQAWEMGLGAVIWYGTIGKSQVEIINSSFRSTAEVIAARGRS